MTDIKPSLHIYHAQYFVPRTIISPTFDRVAVTYLLPQNYLNQTSHQFQNRAFANILDEFERQ